MTDREHLFCGVSLSSGDAALIADGSRPRRLPPEPEGLPGYFRLSTVGPSTFELRGKRDVRDNYDGSRAERLGQDEFVERF
jgi:hypothetical protein